MHNITIFGGHTYMLLLLRLINYLHPHLHAALKNRYQFIINVRLHTKTSILVLAFHQRSVRPGTGTFGSWQYFLRTPLLATVQHMNGYAHNMHIDTHAVKYAWEKIKKVSFD